MGKKLQSVNIFVVIEVIQRGLLRINNFLKDIVTKYILLLPNFKILIMKKTFTQNIEGFWLDVNKDNLPSYSGDYFVYTCVPNTKKLFL